MDHLNTAYDLSIYEKDIIQSAKKENDDKPKIIKVKTGFGYNFKKICNALSITVMLSLIIGVLYTNSNIAACTSDITKKQNAIVELSSEKAYLDFSLESRMSLKYIEEYAVGTLGLVKMDATQVEYIEIEDENKIEVTTPVIKEKIAEAVHPVLSYFMP